MKLAVGSDHAAYALKSEMVDWLRIAGHEVADFGSNDENRVDYCDYGIAVAEAVARREFERGLLFCGTGIGMSIAANKVRSIRAVVCSELDSARYSRAHNDANVLALGARIVGIDLAKSIIQIWLETAFDGGRHAGRLEKIRNFEKHAHPDLEKQQSARSAWPHLSFTSQ